MPKPSTPSVLPLSSTQWSLPRTFQFSPRTAQDASAMRGTMLANLVALQNGADILRVHDVKEAQETVLIASQLATSL